MVRLRGSFPAKSVLLSQLLKRRNAKVTLQLVVSTGNDQVTTSAGRRAQNVDRRGAGRCQVDARRTHQPSTLEYSSSSPMKLARSAVYDEASAAVATRIHTELDQFP